ncbi:CoA transferase [Arthrobacter sp. NyZ413]|uniref:CoA transferase n=1 Tax=Arthrobacter sp. NyZ413 TaxID=3144669 RepID=UPI003BF8B9C3
MPKPALEGITVISLDQAVAAPFTRPFEEQDGTVFLGIQNDQEWTVFWAEVLERPDLALDARFANNSLSVTNRADLHEAINADLSQRTTATVIAKLDAAGIANAQLRGIHGFSAHPQLEERTRWRDVESPAGPLPSLIPPVKSREVDIYMGRVPALGEHTDKVHAELGMSGISGSQEPVPTMGRSGL